MNNNYCMSLASKRIESKEGYLIYLAKKLHPLATEQQKKFAQSQKQSLVTQKTQNAIRS
jgi:hypothetical protein